MGNSAERQEPSHRKLFLWPGDSNKNSRVASMH